MQMRKLVSLGAVFILSAILSSCVQHSSGSIKGQVHLRDEALKIIPIDNAELSLCPEGSASRETATQAKGESDFNKLSEAIDKLDSEMQSEKIQSSRSDGDGNYEFSNLAPGFYCIYARKKTDSQCEFWMAPVLVTAGKTTAINLDLANLSATAKK